MKKFLTFSCLLLASSLAFASYDDIKPGEKTAAAPTSVEWVNANDKALAAATADDVLAAFVRNEASAKALLANVRGAYLTDSLKARQIAAVSQWVMIDDGVAWYEFWASTPRADGRKVWVKALVATAEEAKDAYVKQFCLDQLRWCGCNCPCLVSRIRALAAKSGDKAVADFARVVVRELEGKAIGL